MATWKVHDLHDAIYGIDSRLQTGEILKEYDVKKAMIVVGPNIRKLGYADEMVKILKDAGIDSVIYEKAEGEPTGDMVNLGAKVAREGKIDSIVAVGGGSSCDCAKMIGKVLANNAQRAEELLGGYTALNVGNKVFKPMILLSTTAGTGSEVSYGLMCENMDNLKKTFCLHPGTVGIIDPVYHVTCPKDITACCGMDSLAHSLESLCNSVSMPNMHADMYCKEGISATVKGYMRAYENPEDIEARMYMAYAASIGGSAITLRKTNLGHSISNVLVDYFHFSHGVAVSVGLVAQVLYNVENDSHSSSLIAPCMDIPCPEGADLKAVGQQIADMVIDMQKKTGVKNMKELGVPREFVETIVDVVSKDKKWAIVPNPPKFDKLKEILYQIWDL